MPMASRLQVFFFSNTPSKSMSVPENVSVFRCMLEHRSVWSPVHSLSCDFVAAITVGIGGSQHVESVTNHVRNSIGVSLEID